MSRREEFIESLAELDVDQAMAKLEVTNDWMSEAKFQTEALRRHIKALLEQQLVIATGKEGVQTVEYTLNGVNGKLKFEQKINRTLDQKKVAEVMKALTPATRAKLFKIKYDLSLTSYRALEPNQFAVVSSIVKESPGIPTITFTPTKEAE